MIEQVARLRPYDPVADEPALRAALHGRLIGSPALRARLIEEWQRGLQHGLVLPGAPDAYLFYREFGQKLRVDNILALPEQLGPLLDLAMPRLKARPVVVSQAAAWSRVFEPAPPDDHGLWARHGFDALEVEVLETWLPAHRDSPVPSGYRLGPWSDDHLPLAAQLMESAPDPLQQRVPTLGPECMEIIRAAREASLSALAWRGERLAGFVTARARFGIGQLFVAPPDQGRGVGSALLDRALRQLHVGQVRRARLTMAEGNAVGWRLYSARGFRCCASYPFRYWLADRYA